MNIRFYFKVVFKSLFLLLLLQFVFISLDSLEKNKLQYFVNVAKNISSKGILILTFTNLAHLSLAKHFICNLKDLNIEDSTLLIASDSITHKLLLNFETKIKTILLPSNTEKKDLTYGSKGFKDFIEYRYKSCLNIIILNKILYSEQQLSFNFFPPTFLFCWWTQITIGMFPFWNG